MNAIEHVRETATNVSPLDLEHDPMTIKAFFAKAADAVVNASKLREDMETRLTASTNEMRALRDDVQGLRDTVNRLLAERDQAIRERDEARTEAERIHVIHEDTKRRHKNELDALHETLERRAVSVEALEGERDLLKASADNLNRECQRLTTERNVAQALATQTQSVLADTETLLSKTKTERDDWQLKCWSAEEEVRRQSDIVGKLNSQIQDLEKSLSETRQHVESLRAEVAEWRHGAELAREDHKRASDKLIEINAILSR